MLAQDLRALLRPASGHAEEPIVAIIDSRTQQFTQKNVTRAGYDRAIRKRDDRVAGIDRCAAGSG